MLHEGEGSIEPNVEAKDQVIPRIFDRNIIDAHQEDDINQQKSWSSNLQHPKEIKKVTYSLAEDPDLHVHKFCLTSFRLDISRFN